MQILLTCENSFQWFLAHSWSDLSEINKRSINRDEWQWESQEWQLVSVLIGIPGQDQVWLGHRGLQVEARESQQGDKLRDILSQWTRWPGHRVVPADLPWGVKRRHKGSCCKSKSKNLVSKQASHPMWWVVRRKRSASQELVRRSVPFSVQTLTRKLYGEMQIYLPVRCQIAYFIVKLKERKSKKFLLVMLQLSGGKKK